MFVKITLTAPFAYKQDKERLTLHLETQKHTKRCVYIAPNRDYLHYLFTSLQIATSTSIVT